MTEPALRVVAIDGVLGSGKTTVAARLADRVGLPYLDTGAMYRSIALAALRSGVDVARAAAGPGPERDTIESLARTSRIDVGTHPDGAPLVELDGADVAVEIRSPEVSKAASLVATLPNVRSEMVTRQRAWAQARGGGVLEGRDIASVVFPEAAVKIFLTASAEERAARRHAQQPDTTLDDVLADLRWRDHNDATRAADPLTVVSDATVVDTGAMTVEEVVDRVAAITVAALAARTPGTGDARGTGGARPARETPPPPRETPVASPEPPAATAARETPRGSENGRGSDGLSESEALRRRMQTSPNQLRVFGLTRLIVVPLVSSFFRVRYEGLENMPEHGAFILAPMHRSNVDFALLPRLSKRRMRFLGKDSIWKVKALGSFFDALGGVPVRRGTTDRESMRICDAVLEAGDGLVIFPEGTRQSGPIVTELFDGAAYLAGKHHVPIIPVGIGNSESAMPKGSKLPRPVRLRVIVGKAIPPPDGGRKAVRATTLALREELQRLFDDAAGRTGN